jgi:hypothetical protein
MENRDSNTSQPSFDDLELVKRKDLGKGGYASVKLGRLKTSQQLYAVKIVGRV